MITNQDFKGRVLHCECPDGIRSNNFPIWEAIRKLVRDRLHTTRLVWVKGHNTNKGNIRADILAGIHGHHRDAHTNSFSTPQQFTGMSTLKTLAHMNKKLIEGDVRRTLKQTATIVNATKYTKSKTFKSIGIRSPLDEEQIGIENDWNETAKLINQGIKFTSSFTTLAISSTRTYMTKALHGLLPTLTILHRRAPDTYLSPFCKLCTRAQETNEHMYECQEADEARTTIIKGAIRLIMDALIKLKPNQTVEDQQIIKSALRSITFFRKANHDQNDTQNTLTNLCNIANTNTAEADVKRIVEQSNLVKLHHVCKGIAPSFIKEIILLLGLFLTNKNPSKSIKTANQTFSKVLKYISTEAREQIWKPRCEAMAEWEKTQGISKAIKRNLAARQQHEAEIYLAPDRLDTDDEEAEGQRRKRPPKRKRIHRADVDMAAQRTANDRLIGIREGRSALIGIAAYKKHKFKD